MKNIQGIIIACVVSTIVGLSCGVHAACKDNWKDCKDQPWVDGNKMETPLGSKWWPHPIWGEGDEAGSTNWYTKPEVVLRAMAQVRKGKTVRLGQIYEPDMPLLLGRGYALRTPGVPTGGPFGHQMMMYNDEYFAGDISQVGTQFDGIGHIGIAVGELTDNSKIYFYNGFTAEEMKSPYGLLRLGAEKMHPIVARGILLDIAKARGVEVMEAGEVITMADVRKALEVQGMADFEFEEGDALMFRTGWDRYWITDNEKYNNGCPGIGMEVARWVAEEVKAGVTGADNWPVDAVCGKGTKCEVPEGCEFCVHAYLQARHGIPNQESLKLQELADALAEEGIYTFAYVFTPVPIKGATGSIGSPVAIY